VSPAAVGRDAITVRNEVLKREVSAVEVTQAGLDHADHANDLGALWYVDGERALRDAVRIDRKVARGDQFGLLAGVPMVVKDSFAVAGMPGGGGGPVSIATRTATAVQRLRGADAIVLGKSAMHQLGWGMSGQTPGRPVCRNPRAPDRQPGGSSSGSAVAVAARIVPVALGSDSGGSVRQPAAWCGVVGFKPRQGAVPRTGLLPLAPLLDTVGWLATTIEDCWLMDQAIGTRNDEPWPDPADIRVVVDTDLMEDAEPVVAQASEDAISALKRAGARIVQSRAPLQRARLAPIFAAQLAADWGGIVDSQPELFGADIHAGIQMGRRTSAIAYLEAVAHLTRARATATLDGDVILCPTAPIRPPALSEPDDVAQAGRFTRPFNTLDWPAISIPATPATTCIGIQLAAPPGRVSALWAAALVIRPRQT
jgi:aspartyl-tRNA(Asn)/glutamyl-tRNA(Gln) amidotransferase subunit A